MFKSSKDYRSVVKKILIEIKGINKSLINKKLDFKNKSKSQVDPVTKFDLLIEKKIRSFIKRNFTAHNIIGEEFEKVKKNSLYEWYIDPIDGTKALVMGLNSWSNLIGLFFKGGPILSFANFPNLNKYYYAYGNEAFVFDKKKIRKLKVSEKIGPTRPLLAMNTISNNQNISLFKKLKNKYFIKITGIDALNYCLLCEGKIDVVIESGLKKVDFFPLMKLIKNSGGIITDWNGKQKFSKGDVLVSRNKKLHKFFLKQFKRWNY